MTKDICYLSIRKVRICDCDGGGYNYCVVDTSDNDTQVSDSFDTYGEAESAYNDLCAEINKMS